MNPFTVEQLQEIRSALEAWWGGEGWTKLENDEQRAFARNLREQLEADLLLRRAEAIASNRGPVPHLPYPEEEGPRTEFLSVLTKAYEAARFRAEQLYDALEPALKRFGLGAMVQDREGTVYRVEVPAGTFVRFRQISWTRTRRAGEAKGTLSMETAKAAGFKLPEAVEKKREGRAGS